MDWTAGYASDIEYTAGFYAEQGPGYINLVCALNGYEPPSLGTPFTYFELGFGRGLTASVLAASNPNGSFYAADFNPAHVAGANALAASAQLKNLTLLENSFEELAKGKVGDLPQFDYITLHGIYTWVTAENRQHIIDFVNRYLKPGGAVYVSYNAMPGWASGQPLQRLLVEYGDAFPNKSNAEMDGAAAFVERLVEASSGYVENNPSIKPRLDTLKTGSRNYLVHEYMHKHWQPLYHADVARDFAQAKMEFAGSALLPMAYPALYLSPARKAVMETFPDSVMQETLKDYILNTGFRKDVFVRGLRKMSPVRHAEVLAQVGVALTVPRSEVKFEMKTAIGTFNGMSEVYAAVCDALAVRPHFVGELLSLPSLKGQSVVNLIQVAVLLTSSGQAMTYLTGVGKAEPAVTQKMNAALVKQVRYSDEYQVLCSPLTGNGVLADLFERVAFGLLSQTKGTVTLDDFTRQVWQHVSALGRRMMRDGVALDDEAENLTELRPRVEAILRDKLPVWKQLKML
ncbi:class I SAM-dependent methyltransferase [Duganella aceris]|uniref:Methyltransferase domain-containing protein n=1 Tax=Duganella aceris TaxID=2703883 RepID=A0ABX0FQ83_9BURK|nr:class I SAM-dependent methyltransferase [Duganella aceris]NGZ86524.1 methyltransferase domain-containing protein [Duganella aceris]